jgi:hypothetical protein
MAISAGLAPAGAFSSLLDGLVNKREDSLLAGLIEEPPLAFTSSNSSPVSARAKGKDTKNAENDGGTRIKEESKTNSVSVQVTEAPPLPIIKPPILFRAATRENYSQDRETSQTGEQADEAANGQPDAAVISTTLSPLPATSVPSGNEPAPTARIAFGLHLTASNQETDIAAAGASEFKLNGATSKSAETDLSSPISAARVTVDTNHVDTKSNSSPILNVRNDAEPPVLDLPLSSQRAPSPPNVPEPVRSLGSGDGRDDNAENAEPESETSLWPGLSAAWLASGHAMAASPTALSVDPVKQQDAPGSDRDAKLAAVPFSSAAGVSNLSGSLTDTQAVVLQRNEAGQQNVLGNTSPRTPADNSDATPTRTPATDWIACLRAQQEQKAVDEAGAGGPVSNGSVSNGSVSNMLGSQTDARRDLSEPSGNESRGDANGAQQAAGGPNTRMGRSAGTPPQATSTRTTPAGSAASPSATSPTSLTSTATSSQPKPQATASEATSLQGTLVQAVPNAITLSQAISPQATPSETTASQTAMTAIEPEVNTAPKLPAATQISLQLTGEDSTKVNVDLSERAGKVLVAVRTADPDLTKSMRTDLGDLVERLESKGFKAEAWVPASSRHMPPAAPDQSGSANNQSGPRHSGSGMGQRQGRQGQNGSNQRQQARWTAQLEETLSTEETRTTNK